MHCRTIETGVPRTWHRITFNFSVLRSDCLFSSSWTFISPRTQLLLFFFVNPMSTRQYAVLSRFDLPTDTGDDNTPLHVAALHGEERAVQSLIDIGDYVDSTDFEHRTPLHLACSNGQLSAAKMLIRKGKAFIDATDVDGVTPLMHAVINNHEHVVDYLLADGADIDQRDYSGRTPLMHAVLNDRFEIMEILLGRDADVHITCPAGQTALHLAVDMSDLYMTELLMEYGANPDAMDCRGISPMDLAENDESMIIVLQTGEIPSDDESDLDSIDSLTRGVQRMVIPEASLPENNRTGIKREGTKRSVGTSVEELITCPITMDVMRDPVMAPDGYWYERTAIVNWLRSHGTSPLTKQRMSIESLTPVRPLKHFIQQLPEGI